jgi:hypothetical protein
MYFSIAKVKESTQEKLQYWLSHTKECNLMNGMCISIIIIVHPHIHIYIHNAYTFNVNAVMKQRKINRKFHVATEIGSTFFGCWSVTGQLKKKNIIFNHQYEISNR